MYNKFNAQTSKHDTTVQIVWLILYHIGGYSDIIAILNHPELLVKQSAFWSKYTLMVFHFDLWFDFTTHIHLQSHTLFLSLNYQKSNSIAYTICNIGIHIRYWLIYIYNGKTNKSFQSIWTTLSSIKIREPHPWTQSQFPSQSEIWEDHCKIKTTTWKANKLANKTEGKSRTENRNVDYRVISKW